MRAAPSITVVETAPYLAAAADLLSEAEKMAVVEMIAADPGIGDVIRNTGGLRKVRIPLRGKGKRGGARLITFFHDVGMPVFLLHIYAKNVQADLSSDQRRALKAITGAIRAQYGR